MKRVALYCLLFYCYVSNSQINLVTPSTSPALRFTENIGQWDEFIRFRAQLDGGWLYMESGGLTYSLYDKRKYRAYHRGGIARYKDKSIGAHCVKVEFVGANKNAIVESFIKGEDYENFFLGNDKSKWKSHVNNFHKIVYRNLYEGIDYEAVTTANGIKYNFYVKPGSDDAKIKLKYIGADQIKLIKGELVIVTSIDSVLEKRPYAYQQINNKIVEVPCKFVLEGSVVSFAFPKGYNKNYELIIDPILIFAAQSGSTADNFGMTATYDNAGNLIAGGTVFNIGYPTTPGAYSAAFNGPVSPGNTDVVITKYNTTGTALLFSTYFGGNRSEIVTSLICDPNNNLYLYGATGSSNFPTTVGAYDLSFNGGSFLNFTFNGTQFLNGTDIYVSKFDATGSVLLGSTYLGGSDNDGVNHNNAIASYNYSWYGFCPSSISPGTLGTEYPPDSLAYNYGDQYRGEINLDKNGSVYITSSTRSANFPIVGGFDNTLGGKQDAIVAKFNSSLTNLIWSSFLGGSGNDAGYSILITDSIHAYVTGGTYSTNFPTIAGCYQVTYNGGKADGYVVKIDSSGSAILKSTYIGTSSYDQTFFIQKDRVGNIYVLGQSLGNMPVTPGVYSNPGSHQFITRLDRQLTNVNLSTVIGSGTPKLDLSPSAFSIDQCTGTINFSGWGGNIILGPPISGLPTTAGAFQTVPANGFDFYIFSMFPNATNIKYASYFGSACAVEHVDGGTSRFSETGQLYQSVCAGCGGADDYPVTPGAWPGSVPGGPNLSSNCNNGVFKYDLQPKVVAAIGTNTISGCEPVTVNFTNLSSPGLEYHWNLGGGPSDTTSIILNPVKTFSTPGTYTVTLLVIESLYCNTRDSTQTIITVYPKISSNFSYTAVPCTDSVIFTNLSVTSATTQLSNWSFGDSNTSSVLNPVHTYSASGTYTVQLISSTGFCSDTSVNAITLNIAIPNVSPGPMYCEGGSDTLNASGGTSYQWQPATALSSTTVANPIANPTTTTIYSVTITNTLTGCVRTLTTQVTVHPKPTANFTFTTNPCGGGVHFTDSSFAAITQWNWNFGNSQTSTIQNPYQFYFTGGTYSVTLITGNVFNCFDTIVKPVAIGTPPPVSVSPNQTICLGDYVTLSASGGFAYSWAPSTGLSNPNFQNPIANPTVTTQYSVTITNINSVGDTCRFMLVTNVNVTQVSAIPIQVSANPDTVVIGGSSVLTLTASPNAIATWYPGGTTSPSTGYTVTTVPPRTTTYTVVIQRGPCSETLTVTVWVIEDGCESSDVFIPNTFTPNGDGSNDLMFARGSKIQEMYFAIYNRWGELVFETSDKNVGWDGTFKGRPADVGVFGYYIKFKCYNGLESFKKGNITLIR